MNGRLEWEIEIREMKVSRVLVVEKWRRRMGRREGKKIGFGVWGSKIP